MACATARLRTRSIGPWSALLVAIASISIVVPAGALAAAGSPPGRASATVSTATTHGLATLGGTVATSDPTVTLALPVPSGTQSTVRLVNGAAPGDSAPWVAEPWAPTIDWDVTDPAAGGSPGDSAHKVVSLQWGPGDGTWEDAGAYTIILDRTIPTITVPPIENAITSWVASIPVTIDDIEGSGAQPEFSLDGVRWTGPEADLDFSDIDIGGEYTDGPRTFWARAVDLAGNVGEAVSSTVTVAVPNDAPVDIQVEVPRQAITGHPFTLRPVFPKGYVFPRGAYCLWRLEWYDDRPLNGGPPWNESFGHIHFTRDAAKGGCGEWTFTLPYTVGLHYHFSVDLFQDQAHWLGWIAGNNGDTQDFRATVDSTSPLFSQSTIPFAYVVPGESTASVPGTITYHLLGTPGWKLPSGGVWDCQPVNWIHPGGTWEFENQTGGDSFTCHTFVTDTWLAIWNYEYPNQPVGTHRSDAAWFDPIADGKPPTVSAPGLSVRSGAALTTRAPARITLPARDKQTKVRLVQLQVRTNGGAWHTVKLPSNAPPLVDLTVPLTGKVQYRLRAQDKLRNWSTWKVGSVTTTRLVSAASSAIAYSAGWAPGAAPDATASERMTSTAGGTATYVATARSLAVVARRGPGRGFLQIWLDGKLRATVDLAAATLSGRAVVWSGAWSAAGRHTVQVKALGTSGRPLVGIDGLLVVR
jgi:hypothetical protein